jgi:apolipoprotein N-acyltransferase
MGTRPPWTTGRRLAEQDRAAQARRHGALPPRLLLAAASGLAAAAAFPPVGWWPLAPAALATLMVTCRGQGRARGALLGLVHGVTFFLPLLHWSGVYVGALPWVLLALSQAVFLAVYGAGAAALWRLPAAPLLLAAWWVAVEALRSRVPFGGFPWGRLAFTSAESTLAPLAAVGGAPLVSFATALVAGLLAWAAASWRSGRPGGPTRRDQMRLPTALLLAVAVGGVGALVPGAAGTASSGSRSAVVAVVQGNVPRAGLQFNAEREAVLRNHVAATRSLAARVRAGRLPRPDLVLWPENSSDVDPFRDAGAAALIQSATDDIGVPVLVGAVVDGPGRFLSNTGVVWRPGKGPGARYVKRHPAPFGEYIPLRSVARRVSDKVDLVARDFVAGRTVRTLPMGKATVADVICFEVAYDGLVRDVVRAGGDLLVVQTNNATFGRSGEAVQQLAMTRLRAIEHGRATVQVSTVGVSAIVRPDGTVVEDTRLFTRDVLVARVPLLDGRTLADRLGGWPEALLCLLAAGAVVGAGATARRGTA